MYRYTIPSLLIKDLIKLATIVSITKLNKTIKIKLFQFASQYQIKNLIVIFNSYETWSRNTSIILFS